MASGKLSSRQKMINMMYLVLTALLALNVSKEILNAFVVVNLGLLQQKENLESKNRSMLVELGNQWHQDSANSKLELLYHEGEYVCGIADSLTAFVEQMKIDLLREVDGVNESRAHEVIANPALAVRKDDYDRPTHFFGTSDPPGRSGRAAVLKSEIAAYRDKLMNSVERVLSDTSIRNGDELRKKMLRKFSLLSTEDAESTSWEMKNFYHLPLSAALTELTRWQNFIKGAESDMLGFLWDETSRLTFKFDKVRAAVIPVSSFITSGSDFEADVFLAAYSTSPSNKPEIVFGSSVNSETYEVANPVELPLESVVNGVGKVKFPVTGSGENTFAGVIRYTDPSGDEKQYAFSTKYNVAPPSATISPTNMNVFYIGLENPLSVSVPGVAPNDVVVSCSNCSISGSLGKYTVTASSGRLATVSVSARMQDGSVKHMGKQEFRLKKVPTPTVMWGNSESGETLDASTARNSPLRPVMKDFEFPVYSRIISGTASFIINGELLTESFSGNQPGPQLIAALKAGKPPKKVIFDLKLLVPPDQYRMVTVHYNIR